MGILNTNLIINHGIIYMGLVNNHGILYTHPVIKHEWACYTEALTSILYRHDLNRP